VVAAAVFGVDASAGAGELASAAGLGAADRFAGGGVCALGGESAAAPFEPPAADEPTRASPCGGVAATAAADDEDEDVEAPDSKSFSKQSTNWFRSLPDTSTSTPRPNCATFPVMVRSVTTLTAVAPSPSATNVAVINAEALPWPRVSRPSAFSTATWAESSFDWNVAFPLYCAVIGPTFTFTIPRYSSPSISCS
jgi:hypothetical protein